MKAKLNKKFDLLVKAVDYLWSNRKKIKELNFEGELLDHPDYFGMKEIGNLSGDIVDALSTACIYLTQDTIKSKKDLLKCVCEYEGYSFYSEFIKGFEND